MKKIYGLIVIVLFYSGCSLLKSTPANTFDFSIHDSITTNNISVFDQHLASGVDINFKEEKWGNTPLIHAAYHGRKSMVDRLVKQGADLNMQSYNGWTALHVAVGQEHFDVVVQLLEAGANTKIRNRLFGQESNKKLVSDTPLDLAINFDLPEIVGILRKFGAQTNAELKAKGQ